MKKSILLAVFILVCVLVIPAQAQQCLSWLNCAYDCDNAYDWCVWQTPMCTDQGQPCEEERCLEPWEECYRLCSGDFECGLIELAGPGVEFASVLGAVQICAA